MSDHCSKQKQQLQQLPTSKIYYTHTSSHSCISTVKKQLQIKETNLEQQKPEIESLRNSY